MRRTQFITAAIVAAVTFFSLQAFVGPRYSGRWGWYGRHGYNHWRGGYYDRPWFSNPYPHDRDRDGRGWERKNAPQDLRPDSSGGRY